MMAPSFLSFSSPRAAATSLFLSRLKKDRVGEKEATEGKKSLHVSSAKTVAAASAAAEERQAIFFEFYGLRKCGKMHPSFKRRRRRRRRARAGGGGGRPLFPLLFGRFYPRPAARARPRSLSKRRENVSSCTQSHSHSCSLPLLKSLRRIAKIPSFIDSFHSSTGISVISPRQLQLT